MQSLAHTLLSVNLNPAPAAGEAVPMESSDTGGPFSSLLGRLAHPQSERAIAGSTLPSPGNTLPVGALAPDTHQTVWAVDLPDSGPGDLSAMQALAFDRSVATAQEQSAPVDLVAQQGRLMVPVDESLPVPSAGSAIRGEARLPSAVAPLLPVMPAPSGESVSAYRGGAVLAEATVPAAAPVPAEGIAPSTATAAAKLTLPAGPLTSAAAHSQPESRTVAVELPPAPQSPVKTMPPASTELEPGLRKASAEIAAFQHPQVARRRGRGDAAAPRPVLRQDASTARDGTGLSRILASSPQSDAQPAPVLPSAALARPERQPAASRERLPQSAVAAQTAAQPAPGQRFVLTLPAGETAQGSANGLVDRPAVALQPGPSPAAAAPTVAAPSAPQAAAVPVAPASPVPALAIDTPVLDPAWQTAVNERVVWMAGRNLQHAELRLSPAELGPVQVQVSVEDKAVSVTFSAAHALTRDALENAMPRLRDLLAENGMNLTGSDVSDRSNGSARREPAADNAPQGAPLRDADDAASTLGTGSPAPTLPRGAIDTYA